MSLAGTSYLLKPVVVDKSNWEKALVDSSYYKRSHFEWTHPPGKRADVRWPAHLAEDTFR